MSFKWMGLDINYKVKNLIEFFVSNMQTHQYSSVFVARFLCSLNFHLFCSSLQLPYSEIPLSATYSQDPAVKKLDESHNCYSYAPKVTFPVLCCSPEQALRVRVSVVCDSDTLVDMLTEPYSSSEGNFYVYVNVARVLCIAWQYIAGI